jgi:23S rRNA (uridine2479-2'-O)-methyltransferase
MKPKRVMLYSKNNHYQHLEVLKQNRYKRHAYHEFFVEGVRSLNEAIKNKWRIRAFAYSREKRLSDWAAGILANSRADVHFELPDDLMNELSDKEDASELVAVMEMPEDDLGRIPLKGNMVVAAFDRPSNKGNLGTIIRTCDALGCQGLVVTGHAVDLYDPETIRASMGSLFCLPVIRLPSHNELMAWAGSVKKNHPDLQIVGSSAKGTVALAECEFSKSVLLLIGNEAMGLSQKYKEQCDALVKIPMSPNSSASSLNVACAASIMLYAITAGKQHGRTGSGPPPQR